MPGGRMPILFDAFKAVFQASGQNEGTADKIAQGIRERVANMRITELPVEQKKTYVRFTQDGGVEVTFSIKAVSAPEQRLLDSVAEKTREAVNGALEANGSIGMDISKPASITNTVNIASFLSGKPSEKHLTVYLGVPSGASEEV